MVIDNHQTIHRKFGFAVWSASYREKCHNPQKSVVVDLLDYSASTVGNLTEVEK
jgi:hypothetical protein